MAQQRIVEQREWEEVEKICTLLLQPETIENPTYVNTQIHRLLAMPGEPKMYLTNMDHALTLQPPDARFILVGMERRAGYTGGIALEGQQVQIMSHIFLTPQRAAIFCFLLYRYGGALTLNQMEAQGHG